MRSVYHPPSWGKKLWPGFLQGVGLALLLFLSLPLTQYFASIKSDLPPPPRQIDTITPPPPPPPPPPAEPAPPAPAAVAMERTPDPPRPEAEPLTLRQLELALEVDAGAARGDFAMDFDLHPGGIGDIDVFDVSDVDQPPRPVSARPPRYPRDLQRAGISGSVSLVFIVGRDGSVMNIEVEHSDHRALEQPAVEAVGTWRFLPGEHQGQPARVMVRQTLHFEVQ